MAARAGDGHGQRAAGLSAAQEETWFAYMRLVLRLNYEMNSQLQADTGLSLRDFDVLNGVADSPGQRLQVTQLSAHIGWERSRLSHHLRRMERRGLVACIPSQDNARATDVVLSNEGRRALAAATPGHAALVKAMFFDGLDPALLDPLRDALEQIHEQVLWHGTLPRPARRQVRWPLPAE